MKLICFNKEIVQISVGYDLAMKTKAKLVGEGITTPINRIVLLKMFCH